MEKFIDDGRIHEGHRERMRAKLIKHGQQIFDTYELLEMLLYRVIPYKDTNPVAKNLLYAFGDLDGVFRASRDELMQVRGIGERVADYLITVGGLADLIGSEFPSNSGIVISDYESAGRLFTAYFSGVTEKRVVAIFLDSSMRLIEMKKMYDLEYESGGVRAKAFIDSALSNHAAVIITAHNHPFGPFYPTQGDRATNTTITESLHMAGIVHAEHYIVCGDSFAGLGSLRNFGIKLSQMPAVSHFVSSCDRDDICVLNSSAEKVDISAFFELKPVLGSEYLAELLSYASLEDAQSTAEELLRRYLTVENMFTAPLRELDSAVGLNAALYIKLLAYITSRRRTDKLAFGKKQTSAEIAEYLKAFYLGESVEKICLISFDSRGRLISIDTLGEGTINASEVLPRKAIEVAIGVSAASVSIAHNHPFGTTTPSSDDINLTRTFDMIFSGCGIKLQDHFIVAGQLCDTVIL